MDINAFSDRAASIGNAMAEQGPDALFDELEQLLPDPWKEQISRFPLTAVALALGVGLFLGMKKGDEIIAAGAALVSAAATANLAKVMGSPESAEA